MDISNLGLQILRAWIIWPFLLVWDAAAFILSFKVLPLAWHCRIFFSYIFCYRFNHTPVPESSGERITIFQPTVWTSGTPLGEIDFLGHKSNSTYFTDFDAARAYHISSLLHTGFHKWSERQLWPVLAGVQCIFRAPIAPGQKYGLVTRIVAWDEKSFYLLSHFVKKDSFHRSRFSDNPRPRQAEGVSGNEKLEAHESDKDVSRKSVLAIALARMVLKSHRETVCPTRLFQDCGLLPTQSVPSDDIDNVSYPIPSSAENNNESLLANIESRRARGLMMAQKINALNEGVGIFDVNEREVYSKF